MVASHDHCRIRRLQAARLISVACCLLWINQARAVCGNETIPAGLICGTVFEDDGLTPVPGVTVLMYKQTSHRSYSDKTPIVTNEQGQFENEVEPGTYKFDIDDHAFYGQHDAYVRVRSGERTPVELEASKLSTWSGVICDAEGQVERSTSVFVSYEVRKTFRGGGVSISQQRRILGRGANEPNATFLTDNDGFCQIPRVLTNVEVPLNIFVPGRGHQRVLVAQPEDLVGNRITLRKLGKIEGVIAFRNGDPVANASIRAKAHVNGWHVIAATDEKGRFTLAVPPGDWGLNSATDGTWFEPTRVTVFEDQAVALNLQAERTIELTEQPYRVRVNIVDEKGTAVPSADLLVYPWHGTKAVGRDEYYSYFGPPTRIIAGNDGETQIKSWYELMRIKAIHGNQSSGYFDLQLNRTGNAEVSIPLVHSTSSIAGRVIRGSDGLPVPGVTVYAMTREQRQFEQSEIHPCEPFVPRGFYPNAEANASGTFLIEGVIPGPYELVAAYPDQLNRGDDFAFTEIDIIQGIGTVHCELVVDDVRLIRGMICRPDGTPQRWVPAIVEVSQMDGQRPIGNPSTQVVSCDGRGSFHVRVPVAGRYRVTVHPCSWNTEFLPAAQEIVVDGKSPPLETEFRCALRADAVAQR